MVWTNSFSPFLRQGMKKTPCSGGLTFSLVCAIIVICMGEIGGDSMTLNPDCVRDILLAVESQTGFRKSTSVDRVAENLEYSHDEILYHIQKCEESGFFTEVRHYENGDDDWTIFDLSIKGHKFIEEIRSDTKWSKIKTALVSAGAVSGTALIEAIIAKAIGG